MGRALAVRAPARTQGASHGLATSQLGRAARCPVIGGSGVCSVIARCGHSEPGRLGLRRAIPLKVAACIRKHRHCSGLNHQFRYILEKNPSERARLSQLSN